MDYTLYVWHVLLHRMPLLWRFHLVHHVDLDLDLDTTTALRFHFGEMVISVAWRAGQVFVFGLSRLSLSIWQTALLLSVLFHHSNVRLQIEAERLVNRFIVTPPDAWHSSLHCSRGDGVQLVKWFDTLGSITWHITPQCTSVTHCDRRAGLSERRRADVS